MSGSGYTTMYRGNSASPATLQRVGAVYPANASQGSGTGALLTRDGARLLHVAFVQQPNSNQFWDLLVIDRATSAETYLFRAFQAFEFPAPQEYALNAAGDGACFRLNDAGASSSTGSRPRLRREPGRTRQRDGGVRLGRTTTAATGPPTAADSPSSAAAPMAPRCSGGSSTARHRWPSAR